jgi:hypothetical protein
MDQHRVSSTLVRPFCIFLPFVNFHLPSWSWIIALMMEAVSTYETSGQFLQDSTTQYPRKLSSSILWFCVFSFFCAALDFRLWWMKTDWNQTPYTEWCLWILKLLRHQRKLTYLWSWTFWELIGWVFHGKQFLNSTFCFRQKCLNQQQGNLYRM